MAREATGEVRRKHSGGLAARVRFGSTRESFDLPTCRSEAEARERTRALAMLAQRFARSGNVSREKALQVLETFAAAPARSLSALHTLAEQLLSGELVEATDSSIPTFGELVEAWADGKLAEAFPHQVKMGKPGHLATAKARVRKPCFDPIRDVPVNLVTRSLCDEVMRNIPLPPGKSEISGSTRRQYGLLITRVLNLAELAGLIERSPIPKGWLPKPGPRKRFPVLYPAEDLALLRCEKVPLQWRVFYGFLHREGVRRDEAASLQVRDIDFEHETVSLDENKTNHPRFWRLSPGVAPVLQRLIRARRAGPDDLVFVDENGGPLRLDHMADRVRAHLRAAGLDRADLTSTGPLKGAFGTHCFRRSMVTRNLALGRTDDWVRQRTGHTTDELLRYRQGAKALAELSLGDVVPLNEAIPGLIAPGLPPDPSGREDSNLRPLDPQSKSAATSLAVSAETADFVTRRHPSSGASGQSGGNRLPPDPVEAALADALTRASAAGEWDLVTTLARELEARRRAREDAKVIRLDARRGKGGVS